MLLFDLSRSQHILPVCCISSCTTERAENPEFEGLVLSFCRLPQRGAVCHLTSGQALRNHTDNFKINL